MGLSIPKRLRNAMADAQTQSVLAIIIVIGFVIINVSNGLGWFLPDRYDGIMTWYGPMTALVMGFYFGINLIRNGTSNNMQQSIEKITEQLGKLVPQLQNTITTVNMHGNLIGELLTKFREAESKYEQPKPSTGRTGMDTGLQETDGHGGDPSKGI